MGLIIYHKTHYNQEFYLYFDLNDEIFIKANLPQKKPRDSNIQSKIVKM